MCLIEIVDDHLGDGVALDLDDDARVFVGLVAHRGDVGDDLFVHQFGDALDQHRAIDVVRNFRDDDLFAAALESLPRRALPRTFTLPRPVVK